MKTYIKFSKLLHAFCIFCFFLPFFFTGCGSDVPSGKVCDSTLVVADSNFVDTLRSPAFSSMDSLKLNSSLKMDSTIRETEDSSKKVSSDSDNKDKSLTMEICEKYSFFKLLLMPEEDTYTGFGSVINLIPHIPYYSIMIAIIFLLFGLLIKFIEKEAIRVICLVDLIIVLFLFLSLGIGFQSLSLWGYWVALSAHSILLLLDLYILVKSKSIKVG